MDVRKVTEQIVKGIILSGGVVVAISLIGKWAGVVAENATSAIFPEKEA